MWLRHYFEYLGELKKQQRFSRLTLEICIILAVKVLLLWLLWWASFSNPIPKQVRQEAVTEIILNHKQNTP
jgi:hypothetical protein